MDAIRAGRARFHRSFGIEREQGGSGKVCLKLSKNSCKRKSAREGALFLKPDGGAYTAAWLTSLLRTTYARLRYSFVRVSISILSPMLQKSGTCSSNPVFSLAVLSTLPDDVSPFTAGSV